MDLDEMIRCRVHRILRDLEQFKRPDELSQLADKELPIGDGEVLHGAYENFPGELRLILLITNKAIHLWANERWKSLNYGDMRETHWPPKQQKSEADALAIHMSNGTEEVLPVLGGTEFARDYFEVMRYIDRVIADTNKAKQKQ